MKYKQLFGLIFVTTILFFFAMWLLLVTVPSGFKHSADMASSGLGVAISRSYYNPGLADVSEQSGYLFNARFRVYDNWPSLGFKAIASWFKLFGDDSIYNARLLTALLYAICAVLFFAILLRAKASLRVAVLSTVLFVSLPYHLEFGKLIFADMWLLPFWLLAFLVFTAEAKHHWLIPVIAIFGALAFMWYVIFVLPAFCLLYMYRHYQLSAKQLGILFCLAIAAIWLVQKILIEVFVDVPLFFDLRQWSVFSIFNDIDGLLKKGVHFIGSFLYESIAIIVIGVIVVCCFGFAILRAFCARKMLVDSIVFIALTLLFTVLSFPNWFLTHSFGMSFFSVLIASVGALFLQICEEYKPESTVSLGVVAITLALASFKAYPSITNGYSGISVQARQIISYIEEAETEPSARPNVLFNLRADRGWSRFGLIMAIKEETRAYVFSSGKERSLISMSRLFQERSMKLDRSLAPDFDPSRLYVVTDYVDFIDDIDISGLHIVEKKRAESWSLYELKLQKSQ